jgi:putative ABC transport system permease protein
MIKFLLKGILRDKNRSMLPIIIVSIGVMLTVFLSGYLRGVMGDMVDMTARFQTGHVKVMTEAYAENQGQMPNDLALLGVNAIKADLESNFSEFNWTTRIRFGGLVDVPTPDGNTRSQGPGAGLAIDLFSKGSGEIERLNMQHAMVHGSIPKKRGEAILSDDFAKKLEVEIGEVITFFGSTMNGSMTFQNFILAGTIKFGNSAIDKGAIIIDISDAQFMLDMEDGAGEILGFSKAGAYFDEDAKALARIFNARFDGDTDEFKPLMVTLGQQNNMESMINYIDNMAAIFVGIFVFAMSLVLWNTGLLGGLRRYQEFGIRLALGESKGQIYRSLFSEAVLIGAIGSSFGTGIGLVCAFLLQKYGIDISEMMPENNMMYPNVLRARMTPDLYYIGFIPGLFSMVIGNMLAGLGIYKRETAQLFKELEV